MLQVPVKRLICGFEIPVLGLGTWMIGGNSQRDPGNDGDADAATLTAGIEYGYTHIDTAELYAAGYTEEIVGRAISGISRPKLFITTKVWSTNLSYDGVLRAVEGSMKRMGIDYIDLYLIHKPNDEIPLADTMRALDRLADEKVIRNIGVSNFAVSRFEQAQLLSSHKIVANQVHYNLIFREVEVKGMLDYCQNHDVMLIAWRPLQKGILFEKSGEFMDSLCRKYHKTPAQIALNWLISQRNVATLSTMRSPAHLEENAGAVGWTMDSEDIEFLRKDFPEQCNVSNSVALS
jgi:diketogulonate reductase-like aldo/keto reductase